ncbi:MAG: hypothetical protein AAFY41_16775 [Bacteroidota bacterium]
MPEEEPQKEPPDHLLVDIDKEIKIGKHRRGLNIAVVLVYSYCAFMLVFMPGLYSYSVIYEKSFNVEHLTAIGTFVSPVAALVGTIITYFYSSAATDKD